jgi:hypothetical protein
MCKKELYNIIKAPKNQVRVNEFIHNEILNFQQIPYQRASFAELATTSVSK